MRASHLLAVVLATAFAGISSISAMAKEEVPSNLVATPISANRIELSWQDNSRREAGFLIERARDNHGVPAAWARIATVRANVTVFQDQLVAPNRTYWYRVCAIRQLHQRSPFSNPARATTFPGSPSQLTATATSASEIDVTWRGNAFGETGFKLERAPDNGGSAGAWAQIALLPATTIHYSDAALSPGRTFWYRVRAYNTAGDSAYTAAVSARTSCALSVVGWGDNPFGQASTPSNLDHAVAIAAGNTHSLALKHDGTVLGWGDNGSGQASPPTNLAAAIAISAGDYHSIALKSNGTVVCWGDNYYGQSMPPTNLTGVIAIAAGGLHSLALKSDGTVVGWGYDGGGEATPPTNLAGVVAIAAGEYHSLALKSDGTVVGWGENYYGEATPPTNLTGVIAIAAGSIHSLALKSDGTVVGWGYEYGAQTIPPTNLAGVIAISAGRYHSLALKGDGTVVGWGEYDYYGQLNPGGLGGAVAISGGGSHSLALTTIPAAPAGVTVRMTAADGVQLSWTATSAATGGFRIERAPDTNSSPGDWVLVGTVGSNVTTYDDTGLTTNATYWYRMQALNSDCGDSIYSYPVAVMLSAPVAPFNLYAALGSTNHVDLAWNEYFGGVDGFRIERATVTNGNPGTWVEIATMGATNSFDGQGYLSYNASFSDTVGSAIVTYWYRVRAFNALGDSDYSAVSSIDIRPPYPPSLSGNQFVDTAQLSWFDYDSYAGIAGFKLERAPDAGGQPGTWTLIVTTNGSFSGSYTDTGLPLYTTNWYRVRAFNWVGDSDFSQQVAITILPPGAPYILSATIGNSNQVDLTWGESLGDQDGFKLERAPDTGGVPGTWVEIATLNVSNTMSAAYHDSDMTPNAVWWYRVRAFNRLGTSDYSLPVSINVAPPAAPYYIYANPFRDQINLNWYDGSIGVMGYKLERALDVDGSPGTWTEIKVFSPTLNNNYVSYTDTALTANTTYWYRVRAFNWVGDSDYSGPTSATIVPPAAPYYIGASIGISNQVNLTWYDPARDEDGFKLERAPDAGGVPGDWTEFANVPSRQSFDQSYADTNVTANTTNWYRVRAYNLVGNSDYSNPVRIALVPPSAPYLYVYAFRDQAQLNWSEYSGGVMGFKVERAADAGGSPGTWTEITETEPSQSVSGSYIDPGLAANTTYWYRVRAFNWTGDSLYSLPFSITIVPPGTPYALVPLIGTTNQVNLLWQDGFGDEDGFFVEIAPDAGGVPGTWTGLATVYATNAYYISYTNTNAVAYTTNWYRVRAFNAIGISDYAGPVSSRTVPPPAPTYFSAYASRDQANLTWYVDYSTYGFVDGFRIERAPDAGGSPGTWEEIGTVTDLSLYSSTFYYTDTGRPAGSTWWYRLRAYDWIGAGDYVAPLSVTMVPPNPPDSLSASISTTTNQANLFWYDYYNDEDGFLIERAPDVAGGPGLWTGIATIFATNYYYGFYTDSNVVANTTNWYRVRAFNIAGISTNSNLVSLAIVPPAAPYSLNASPFADKANLYWYDFDIDTAGVAGFNIDRAPDVAGQPGTWAVVATLTNAYNNNYYSDPGLALDTKYWYRVRAYNWIGDSSNSPYASVTIVLPVAPYSLSANVGTSNRVDVNWYMGYPNDEDGFRLERAPDSGGAPGSWTKIATIYATNVYSGYYADTNVIANSTLWYRVRAFNAVGNSPYSDPASVSITPPLPPAAFTLHLAAAREVDLSWSPGYPGRTDGYRIERAPDVAGAPGTWAQIKNLSGQFSTSYSDRNVVSNATYWYRVQAYNWVGDSPDTDPLVIHIAPPPAPANFAAHGYRNQVNLSWIESSADATGFMIERAADTNGSPMNWTPIASLGYYTTNYTDTGLEVGQTYWYRASAHNVLGDSPYSDPAKVTLGSTEAGLVSVDWNDVHQRIDGFGASSAWRSGWSTALADMFFSTNTGIGLSFLRTRIAPDGSTLETSIMQLAQARGARVWSTPWSPPATMKDSGTVNGGNYLGGDVTNAAYASQLARYAANMKSLGINLYAISIQNEPDYNTTSYESCLWNGQQFHDFIPYLHNALAASNAADVRIMLPEQANWTINLAANSMHDTTTSNEVGILAAHGYFSSAAPFSRFGKALWETEDSQLSSAGPFDGSIGNGIYWAQRINSFLTIAEVNAWHYWWLIGANADNEGLTDSSGNPAKRMYVLGQFSRFVRPDYYRIGVHNNSSARISAYKDSASPGFAIVAINPNSDLAIDQTFVLTNVSVNGQVVPWITSDTFSLSARPAISVTNSTFTFRLPAYSVVTFVGQADASNAAPTLQPIVSRVIDPGFTLAVTNSATDPDASQTLTFSLLNGPASATLNSSNGVFVWRPMIADAGTTNAFTVQVADNGSPSLKAQQSFTVTVNPLTSPQLAPPAMQNGHFMLQVSGVAGPDYAIQASSNLVDWSTVFVTNSAPALFQWIDTNTPGLPERFYRVRVGPPLP